MCSTLLFSSLLSILPNRSYAVDCAPDMGYKICSPCEVTNFAIQGYALPSPAVRFLLPMQ